MNKAKLPPYAIQINALSKTYKAGKRSASDKIALHDVSLDIPRGSIFGLLGPNGAGKSTIINILAGLTVKSSGSVRVWGNDIDDDIRAVKSAIGIVPQEITQDWFFTPRQTLEIQAGLYGVPKSERRTDELLALLDLSDKAHAYSRTLSGGMKRRLMVAKAMVHSPPVLVLDEPTAGVDVELRRELWQNVKNLNASGVTIVLTTHYLEEAEELCDQIAIINHGQIIVQESKEDILSRINNKEISFRLTRSFTNKEKVISSDFDAIKAGSRTIKVKYKPGEIKIGVVIQSIHSNGFEIEDISTQESDLEDVFLQLTSAKRS